VISRPVSSSRAETRKFLVTSFATPSAISVPAIAITTVTPIEIS
jgi:hypothetical protein